MEIPSLDVEELPPEDMMPEPQPEPEPALAAPEPVSEPEVMLSQDIYLRNVAGV